MILSRDSRQKHQFCVRNAHLFQSLLSQYDTARIGTRTYYRSSLGENKVVEVHAGNEGSRKKFCKPSNSKVRFVFGHEDLVAWSTQQHDLKAPCDSFHNAPRRANASLKNFCQRALAPKPAHRSDGVVDPSLRRCLVGPLLVIWQRMDVGVRRAIEHPYNVLEGVEANEPVQIMQHQLCHVGTQPLDWVRLRREKEIAESPNGPNNAHNVTAVD